MHEHPLCQIIKSCDRAISAKDFDSLMEYYAEDAALVVKPGMIVKGKNNIRNAFVSIADYFQDQLIVKQGDIQVIEGGGDALVIMETHLFSRMNRAARQKSPAVQPMFSAWKTTVGCAPLITLMGHLSWTLSLPEALLFADWRDQSDADDPFVPDNLVQRGLNDAGNRFWRE